MNKKINKYDFILIFSLLFISFFGIIILNINNKKAKFANVYYDNDLVLKIDLSINKEYVVDGYNGSVKIKVYNNKVKVVEENSPYHLCSKKGYISKSYESIVCLPNKIVIDISSKDEIDTVVR